MNATAVAPSGSFDPSGDGVRAPSRPVVLELLRAFSRSAAFSWKASSRQRDRSVPTLQRSPLAFSSVLVDELLTTAIRLRSRGRALDVTGMLSDAEQACAVLRAGGYVDDPRRLHPPAVAPHDVRLSRRVVMGMGFEHISFDSLYRPPDGLPRADQWFADDANHVAHAYVLRRDDLPRPWVVVLHGHGAGEPLDLLLMGSRKLMHTLDVNVVHPILPLHGPRSRKTTLDRFPALDPLTNFYGLSQGIWDARQVIAWARREGATQIGVHGASLGGHAAALLASIEPGLACVVAGIPTVDFSTLLARHTARLEGEAMVEATHLLDDAPRLVNSLVSPLAYAPLVARAHRFIYAGVGDRVTSAEQAAQLWRHWDEPEILWVHRGHLGAPIGRATRRFVLRAMQASGVGA
jgi:hypothetical protein